MSATREEMIACLDRELALRVYVYGARVGAGAMTQGKADHELRVMRAVRDVVFALPVTQGRLFP